MISARLPPSVVPGSLVLEGFQKDRPILLRYSGNPYMSDDFQQELSFLGMTSSPSFVREPEGNGVAERFIRTLKENLLWVRHFATVVELIEALREFRRRYNERWLIERHGYRSPAQVRRDLTAPIPAVA